MIPPPSPSRRSSCPYRECTSHSVSARASTLLSAEASTRVVPSSATTRRPAVPRPRRGAGPGLIGWFVVNDEWLVYSVEDTLYARPRIGGKAGCCLHGATFTHRRSRATWSRGTTSPRTARIRLRFTTCAAARAPRSRRWTRGPVQQLRRVGRQPVGVDRRARDDRRLPVHDASAGATVDHTLDTGKFRYPGYPQPTSERIYSLTSPPRTCGTRESRRLATTRLPNGLRSASR